MEEEKSRSQLAQAAELFGRGEYAQCRKVLGEVKGAHASCELNLLLCEYKESPTKAPAIIKKLMDILITLNIKLYEERPKQPPGRERAPRIAHELYYWNMAVVAQVAGESEIWEEVVSEALHFTDGLRTETSLMLIHQMLGVMVSAGRLASCIALIERQNRLLDRVRSTGKEAQTYRLINQLLFNRVLQKLGMIDGSRIMFSMRFAQDKKEEAELADVSGIPVAVHRHLLSAEIEYHAGNYPLAMRALSELLPQAEALGKNRDLVRSMVDHNLAIVLANYQKSAAAQLLLRRSLVYFTNAKELVGNNERCSYIARCKENLLLAGLLAPCPLSGLFESLRACGGSNSYKFNYRKAQVCLKYYHEILASPSRVLPFREVHDSYETVYFYPNQPYFQQKGKNKNPNFTNGKAYYRRYLLPDSDHPAPENAYAEGESKEPKQESKEKEKEKEKERRKESKSTRGNQPKKEEETREEKVREVREQGKDPHRARLREVLLLGEWYLKQALSFLEKEKSIIVNLEGEEKGLTEQVNEKLYSEYLDFKASILSLLCYVSLCRREWTKAVRYATLYQEFERQYQLQGKSAAHQQTYYSVLTYKMEAQCELGRPHKAYDLMQDAVSTIEYAESAQLLARSTGSEQQGQAFLEPMSQYANFCFNISVLHSRDNKIPEAFQAIQKMLQLMRISPSSPQARLPLSMVDLLVHYNLRTGNVHSALQMLKRRRILNVPGVIPQYQPILNVTK